ncbi:MAG TPA: hypothetical protein VEB64_14790 [Azospirillaceae bacterium]|nr:hypothetical protein [Azospirillaceae bacterium]
MTRFNDFAQLYAAAHAEAGLSRILISQILARVENDPGFLFSPEFGRLGGQCPVAPGTRQDDLDKVTVNTLLAFLYDSLRQHILARMPFSEDGRIVMPPAPESPFGLSPDDRAGLALAPPETLCAFLRDCSCHLLDALIADWTAAILAEEERCRSQGEGAITPIAAASFLLGQALVSSHMHQRSGYDMLSITKTGSHTALHVCWSLVEAAPLVRPRQTTAYYDSLVRRSLKQVLPLSAGSLGMLVHYMETTGIEAPHHQATHVLPLNQTAFIFDDSEPDGMIRLNTDAIKPIAAPGERYFTGCPAFYAINLINVYGEIAASLAVDYGVYDRLQERGPQP